MKLTKALANLDNADTALRRAHELTSEYQTTNAEELRVLAVALGNVVFAAKYIRAAQQLLEELDKEAT